MHKSVAAKQLGSHPDIHADEARLELVARPSKAPPGLQVDFWVNTINEVSGVAVTGNAVYELFYILRDAIAEQERLDKGG